MENVWLDLRRSMRSLLRTPGLSLAALTCVALGIGSAVFIFTVAYGVLARALPFPDSDRLLRVWKVDPASPNERRGLSYLDYKDLAARTRAFDAVEVVGRTRLAVVSDDGAERMRGEAVSGGYFAMIGLRPAKGRLFATGEYRPNAPRVIVISHDMWQRKYAGRADILGKTVRARGFSEGRANDELRTIVGVMPPGFAGTVDEDISEFWIPIEHYAPHRILEMRGNASCWLLARLRTGVSINAAQAEIVRLGAGIGAENPEAWKGASLRVEPLGELWRGQFRTGLLMLSGASILLLLITSTNIANLLLARLAQREHELTLRMALGATRRRIIQQLLTESVLLSLAGGVIGIGAAMVCLRLFLAANVIALPRYAAIAADTRVIAFAALLVLATGILFGAVPALFGSRVNPGKTLREAVRGGTQGRRQRLAGEGLVMLEIALTVVLLIASMLMLRTWRNLASGDVGFRTANLLRMAITLDATAAAPLRFVDEARAQLESVPGVEKVTFMAGVLPPYDDERVALAVNGVPVPALADARGHAIDDRFFDVLGIKLLRGRAFTDRESARVAIVSKRLAAAIGEPAIGRTIQFVDGASMEIIGIASDIQYQGPLSSRGFDYDLYVPIAQRPDTVLSMGIATSVDPATLIQPLQQKLGKLAPTSPTHWISTMEEELSSHIRNARLYAWLSSIFGGSALLLAILGVYGVLANSVSRRSVEIGVRMALGAGRGDIARLVVREGMIILLCGFAAGAVLAAITTRLLRSLLYGIAPGDVMSYAIVSGVVIACGVLATYIPAARATRVEPVVTLRG
ncbi:MAG TPA: ABC transporter permease [Thermoanaerobaculia bacterium]|nr:ABC transporter permease [Thermoanaerobaculia bacterium]